MAAARHRNAPAATLPGRSRTIVVEPLEQPVRAPEPPPPAPEPEPDPPPPAPAEEPEPTPA